MNSFRDYTGVLVLIVVLIAMVGFRRRRERRLAAGWSLEEPAGRVAHHLVEIGSVIMMMGCGGILFSSVPQIDPYWAFFAGLLVISLGTRKTWKPPAPGQ